MSGELRFDEKVVIITGAGNGLGRAHAHLFASRGAKVVVNDLGGSATGEGAESAAADEVVEEIRAAGGEAVANHDSVEFGDRIVQTALDTWGRVDVVINNAGILRDRSFQKMSDEDWRIVHKVHVLGAFRVAHAAWPHLREQRYGRILNTASAAGVYGNFGQANYAAAKLALVGFSNTLAVEGAKRNIHTNTIAPLAASRLTEGIVPDAMFDALGPELVSPLVLWLCHEDCEENGGLFEVGGGFFAKLRWERAGGRIFRLGRSITAESVRESWGDITDFSTPTHPESVTASMGPIIDNLNAGPSKGGNRFIDCDQALGYVFPDTHSDYTERDVTIYALGVGAGDEPLEDRNLQVVYENHGGGFKVLPTFAVAPVIAQILEQASKGVMAPGLNYGLDRLLHGEQKTELFFPLPPAAKLTHRSKVKDIFDKGKGALVIIETGSFDEDGDQVANNVFTAFIRGAGGWGGERGPSTEVNVPPERDPDATIEQRVAPNQALLYRLSGDWNPLHVDPGFASAFGFDKPILHGLCTYGYVARHVIDAFCGGDPRYFRSIQVRFAGSVFPGETLVTEMWKESDTRVVFRCKVAERDSAVISHAAVELYTEIPKKPEPVVEATGEAEEAVAEPTAADAFGVINDYVAEHPELVGSIGKVYQFAMSDPDSVWTLDLKDGTGSVDAGETVKPDCTLALTDADFVAMATGQADPMKLYMGGQLKISGDLMASQKLDFLQSIPAPEPKARGAAAAAAPAEPTSADAFIGIGVFVSRHPELVDQVGKVFAFELSEPDSVWTLDLKNAPGSVTPGTEVKADCTLGLTDADFMRMTSGEADPMKLYMDGALKISGDLMASQKLTFLQEVDPKEVADEVARIKAESSAPTVVAAPKRQAAAPTIFEALKARLAETPAFAGRDGSLIRFDLSSPEGSWTVDLRGEGSVSEGPDDGALTTLSLEDEHLAALASGATDARDLFQRGQLRIDGDIHLAHNLDFLDGLA